MQRSTSSVRTLLGALLLSAGLASPLAMGDEPSKTQESPSESKPVEQVVQPGETSDTEREDADFVEVRISLPDGRTIVRLEPKRTMSARYSNRSSSPGSSTSRTLPDGSRISVGSRGVTGGSNSSSVRTGGGSGGGGGGGGGSSAASGGGGSGGGSSGEDSKSRNEKHAGGGVFSYGSNNSSTNSAQSSAQNSESSAQTPRPIPTVGDPVYDREGNASGGQRVEFNQAGMSAAVIGNMVYFIGVELVSSNAPFEVITGTRVAEDSVIMDDQRLSSPSNDPLSSFNTANSQIKLEMESGTTVDLVMFSRSSNPDNPERVQHTWTVRIR